MDKFRCGADDRGVCITYISRFRFCIRRSIGTIRSTSSSTAQQEEAETETEVLRRDAVDAMAAITWLEYTERQAKASCAAQGELFGNACAKYLCVQNRLVVDVAGRSC